MEELTWLLEIYLTRFLNTKTKKIELFKYLPVTKLISFNYTDTYTRMYKKETNTVHYIHGFAAKDRIKEENNMVFGIGSEIKNVTLIMISMIILNFKSIIKGLLKKQVITTLNG